MTSLEHTVERSVLICATRSTVFRFFTDPARFAEWWGPGSRIEGRPGGAIAIRYPGGTTASGTVLEILEGERIVFTYGYDAQGGPIPPDGSRVTITLHEHPEGTLVKLRHEVADAASRDYHVQGWRYQLALFANVAARDQHGDVSRLVDRYFGLWSAEDVSAQQNELAAIAAEGIVVRDAFSCTRGWDDLSAHLAAARVHMPGVRLQRQGEVRHCQGTVVAEWTATGSDGALRGRGTNVFDLAPDGRIARVVGFWST